jgi:hypothetical protein
MSFDFLVVSQTDLKIKKLYSLNLDNVVGFSAISQLVMNIVKQVTAQRLQREMFKQAVSRV